MSVETFTTLLQCSFPLIVIIGVAIYVISNSKKNKDRVDYETTPPTFFGMRAPTDEEAKEIRAEVLPRVRKNVLVMSLVFIPLIVIISGAAYSITETESIGIAVIMGTVASGVLLMYIGIVSMPLYEIISLYNKLYSVGDCYFADVQQVIRVNHRGIPCTIYHAVIKDQIGTTWETDLPKDLRLAQTGMRCLVIIYASERKVNKKPTNGKSLYRIALYVPKDEFM